MPTYDSALSTEVQTTTVLPAPTLETAATDTTSADLTWTATHTNGDTRVEFREAGDITWTVDQTVSRDVEGVTITGLNNGTTYDFRVVATTSDADSPSNTLTDTTVLPNEDQPVLGNGVEDEIAVDRESALTNAGVVRLQARETGETAWDSSAVGFAETTIPYDTLTTAITGREDGERYEVRARTETDDVAGPWTEPIAITTKFPGVVNLAVTAAGETTIEGTWDDRADNESGQEVIRERRGPDGEWWPERLIEDVGPNTEAFVDDTVQPGREYRYRIRAYTDDTSATSSPDTATTDDPGLPTTRIPPNDWRVEIDHPDGETLTPTVLEGSTPKGSLNDIPRVEVRVPKSDRWDDLAEERPAMRVWKDGERLPIEQFVRPVKTPEATVLHGRGGVELDTDVEFDVGGLVDVHDRARQLVDDVTSYATNFDDPESDTSTDVPQQSADGGDEWSDVLLVEPGVDDLWFVDGDELRTQRTAWIYPVEADGAVTDTVRENPLSGADYWSDEQTYIFDDTTFNGLESGVTATATLDTEVPVEALEIAYRGEHPEPLGSGDPGDGVFPGEGSYHHGFSVRVEGYTLENVSPDSQFYNQADPIWRQFGGDAPAGETVGPGTVEFELRFNEINGVTDAPNPEDAVTRIDSIALVDTRSSPGLQDDLVGDARIAGDEYPAAVEVETTDSTSIEQIVGATLDVTANDDSGDFEIALSPDSGGTYPLSAGTTSVTGAFDESTTTVRARFTLGGYDDGGRPVGRNTPQRIDSFDLSVNLDDTPFVTGTAYDGTALEVLQQMADNHDFVFSVEWDDEADAISVEWTQPGQRSASSTAGVLDYEGEVDAETLVERTIVYGRSRRVRDQEVTLSTTGYTAIGDDYIQPGTDRVVDADTGEVYQINDDYEILFNEGSIKAVSSGSIDDGTNVLLDFETRIAAEYALPTADGSRDTIRRTVASASTRQLAEQAALAITTELAEPQRGATVTLDRSGGFDLVGALDVDAPIDPQVVRDIQERSSEVEARLGNRLSAGEVVDDVRRRVESVAQRL